MTSAVSADWRLAAAVAIFLATYLVVAVGKLPGFHIDRAGAALLGAALMVASGVLPLEAAYRAIDLDTLVLLLGMMIVVANLRLSGVFRLVNAWAVTRARRPILLLAATVLGAHALALLLAVLAVALLARRLTVERPIVPLLAIIVAALIYEAALALLTQPGPIEWRYG